MVERYRNGDVLFVNPSVEQKRLRFVIRITICTNRWEEYFQSFYAKVSDSFLISSSVCLSDRGTSVHGKVVSVTHDTETLHVRGRQIVRAITD